MKSTYLLIFLLLFSANLFASEPFDIRQLSERGQKSYEVIKNAQRFEDLSVSYYGLHSNTVRAYGVIADEEHADEAFKSLVKNATLEGSLYALAATFYTDQEFFYKTARSLKLSSLKVRQGRGCLIFTLPVSKAIESNAPNVAIIGSGESFEQYMSGVQGSRITLDLINGGFPAALRYFAQKQKEKSRRLWKRSISRSESVERLEPQ